MSYSYCTEVKASTGFWENRSIKLMNDDSTTEIKKVGAEAIQIVSRNKTPLDKIVNLSKEYSNEIFLIKIYGEDFYENLVSLYECTKGELRLLKEGFEYCFVTDVRDLIKLPNGLFTQFQRVVADYYHKLEQYSKDHISLDLFLDEEQKTKDIDEDNISLYITYRTKELSITAWKRSKTYIEVTVDFFDKHESLEIHKTEIQNECNASTESEDLPF